MYHFVLQYEYFQDIDADLENKTHSLLTYSTTQTQKTSIDAQSKEKTAYLTLREYVLFSKSQL